jgi:hypothetical protein
MANVPQLVSNNNSDVRDFFLLRNKFPSLSYDELFVKELKQHVPAMSNLVISKANTLSRGFCVS